MSNRESKSINDLTDASGSKSFWRSSGTNRHKFIASSTGAGQIGIRLHNGDLDRVLRDWEFDFS